MHGLRLNVRIRFQSKPIGKMQASVDEGRETESAVSFANRQKELGALYKDFRQALAKMKALPEFSTETEDSPEERAFFRTEATFNDKTSDLQTDYQLRGILRELQSMQAETSELKDMLKHVKPSNKRRLSTVIAKVDSVLRVISLQIERVHGLLESK